MEDHFCGSSEPVPQTPFDRSGISPHTGSATNSGIFLVLPSFVFLYR